MRFVQKSEFFFQKSSYLLSKKTMTFTLDPLLSYKYVILFSIERMILTQPPPTFLLDVTHFTVKSKSRKGQGKVKVTQAQPQLQVQCNGF